MRVIVQGSSFDRSSCEGFNGAKGERATNQDRESESDEIEIKEKRKKEGK